jgi:hypothetical protein
MFLIMYGFIYLLGAGTVFSVSYIVSRAVGSIAYALQNKDTNDGEAKRRASMVANVVFVLFMLLGCLWFLSIPLALFD